MPKDLGFNIHCLICTYNDYPTLPLALDSVRGIVDSIIIADGAYQKYYENMVKDPEWRNAKPHSTDGTLDIIKSLEPILPPIKLIGCPDGKPWLNQTVKRTALLDAVPVKDWFVILDSDEMFFGNLQGAIYEVMESGCLAGSMPMFQPGVEGDRYYPFWHPRIFLKLPGMYYERKHWLLCDFAHRVIETSYPMWATNQCVLSHMKVFRNMRRLAPHMSYMLDMSSGGWQEPETDKFQSESDNDSEVNELYVEG